MRMVNLLVFASALAMNVYVMAGMADMPGMDHGEDAVTGSGTIVDDRSGIMVSEEAQAKAGLKTYKVKREKLLQTLRTVGSFASDQTREAHVHTRINGWIEKIHVDYVGKVIKKGDALFELYSPDLASTQEEYLTAIQQGESTTDVAESALKRLRLWGVAESELKRLQTTRTVSRTMTFYAPVSGIVLRKSAILGMYATPDMELYYLGDTGKLWLLLTLYEGDLSRVNVGDVAEISLPYDPAKRYSGKISYIYPEVDVQSRTAKARVEIDNTGLFLRPGMFANVDIRQELEEMLVVPDDSVLDTGMRKIVFVKTSTMQFEPREVQAGSRVNGMIAILSGLTEGEEVVVSASFLIDAESRIQAALRKGKASTPDHGSHGKK